MSTATAYLILKASRANYGVKHPETGLRQVDEVRISGVRQNRPASMARDEVLVKVSINIPDSAFDPIMPQALIVVPEGLVLARHEIEAEATEDSR